MNRRRFLGLLAGAGAASAASYFFAPVGGWKSDVILSPQEPHNRWADITSRRQAIFYRSLSERFIYQLSLTSPCTRFACSG